MLIDSFQRVRLIAGPEHGFGHAPWKDDAAGIGSQPFLRPRIQVGPQDLDGCAFHCLPPTALLARRRSTAIMRAGRCAARGLLSIFRVPPVQLKTLRVEVDSAGR